MNKEQQELLGEAYSEYSDSHWTPPSNPKGNLLSDQLWSLKPMEHSKESFTHKCKTDNGFAQKWGLKIEERELSLEERVKLILNLNTSLLPTSKVMQSIIEPLLETHKVPTKQITVIYKNQTIESYE